VLETIREMYAYRSLLRDLVSRDLKVRYKRSVLGVVWTMLNPLLLMLVFAFVFAHVFQSAVPHFAIYLMCGLLVWNFFSQATSWSTGCLLGYSGLIKKIYVPKAIFIVATVLAGLVNLLLSLVPLALIMVVTGHPFHTTLLFLPVPIFLLLCFSLGLSWLLAPLCTLFQDIVQIYTVLLQAWFYLTPIIYPLEALPERYRGLVFANPVTYLVEAFRAPIYSGTLPSEAIMVGATVSSLGMLVVGLLVFERYSDRIAYYL
jgi:ABC-type polysaccharide/polyol phosphate export permease